MTNAPSERDDYYYARRRDAYRPSAEGNVPWPHGRSSTNPYDSYISPDHHRQPHHRLPSHMVPPRHSESPQEETWSRRQEPVSSLSHPRPTADDTQRSQRVVHLGDAYYSDHHPRESGFGFQPSMTNYYGQSRDQRQNARHERTEETSIRPDSRRELDEYESRHRATRQRSMHPNMAPSAQPLPPERPSQHRRHDSSYDHAPPRHSSRSYGMPTEDARYLADDRLRRAPYADEYREHVDFRDTTYRRGVEQKELTYTRERVGGGFLPHSSQVSNSERQRHYSARFHENARQSSREALPALHTHSNHHDTRERQMGSLGRHENGEHMIHHNRASTLEDRYVDPPPAYQETVPYARDNGSHEDQRTTGAARQHSEAESGRAQSVADEEQAKKEKAMNFAIQSFERGELEDVLNCGSPYLEQAARILQQKVLAAEAAKRENQWRAKPVLKPVRGASYNGPFVQSDEDEDDGEEVTPSGTASGRKSKQNGSITTVETAAPKQVTPSSGAVESKLLRGRARHDTPIRATGYDFDTESLFGGSNASDDQEPLFVPRTTPVKQKHSDPGSAIDSHQDSSRQKPSPDTVIVHDQNPEPSTLSNAAPTPFSMMSREQMARMMVERNRAIEVISQRPQIPQIAKTTQPSLAEIGDSRERAISISSEKSESPLSDSSSDEHGKENGDADGNLTAEQHDTKEFTRALDFIQSSASSSTPVKSTTAPNTESAPKSTTHIPSTAATTPARKLEAPPKSSAASGQPSGWQAATAIVQKLPAATNVKTPNTATPAASNAKSPEANGVQSKESKKHERERPQTLESFGEDIMALRAEMARQKQQKREAEDQREELALSESDNDEEQGEGPQIDTFPKVTPKRRGRPPGPTSKKTVEKKPAKPVKKKAPAKKPSPELIASESDESDSDADTQTQTTVQRLGQKNDSLAQEGPISLHNYALAKRKAEEPESSRTKKRKTCPEQHGLPALESPIASPEMNSFLKKYGGDKHAMKAHAPICAQVLAEEMDRDDDAKTNGNPRSPRLKRTTPPPKPIKTSDLRPAYRKGKAWPEAVHVPIEDQEEPDETAVKPAKRSPKTPRKAARKGANAPRADAGGPENYDGIIMVNQKFATPPSNRSAQCLELCEADKLLVKWREMRLKWEDVRILYANETNQIFSVKSLQTRYKRVLKENSNLAAAAVRNTDVPPSDNAPVPASAEKEGEEEAGPAKQGPGGKSWNVDAMEAFYANQCEIDAYFASGENESDDEPVDDEKQPHLQQPVRGTTPEGLDKNECWWMYQVWRKSWTNKTEEEKEALRKEKEARKKEKEMRNKEKAKEKEMRVREKESKKVERELKRKEKEEEKIRAREMQDMLSHFPGPTAGDLDEGSETMSESDSDSDSDSGSETEEEYDEEVDPEEAAEKYVAGNAYYHTLDEANEATLKEIRGQRFRIGGIGPPETTGLMSHTSKVGPHGMFVLEAHYFNGNAVRVWVDRFARTPGTADPPVVSKHGWLAKMVWVVKRKDVEVRLTRRANHVEAVDGDAMDVDEESKIVAVKDLATFTILDGANDEAAQRALDFAYPPSQRGFDQIQARIEAKRDFDAKVRQYEETNTTFEAGFEGEEEVLRVAGEQGSGADVVTTKRVDTTFWVEGAMLQGPRNV